MAENKFIIFEQGVPEGTYNTIDDDALSGSNYITPKAVAYTNILNATLRQTTVGAHSLAAFVAGETDEDVTSKGGDVLTGARVKAAVEKVAQDKVQTLDNKMPFVVASGSGVNRMKVWFGTEAEYALATKDEGTLYFIY